MMSSSIRITEIPRNLPLYTDLAAIFLSDTPMLDVRAPVEFNQGAFPGAVNIPLMNDAERHQVGIEYKENGQQSAIELGHNLVKDEIKQARVNAWIEFTRQHPDGVLYCFRGGLRSQIAQTWLHEAGVDYPRIAGGYKAMRQFLIQKLETISRQSRFIVVGGLTGSGKTDVIHALQASIDLEGLAKHRGSSFGGMVENQPSQIDFENALAIAMFKLNHRGVQCLAVEDEGHLIGRCAVPLVMREQTSKSPMVWVTGQTQERVQRIQRDYIYNLHEDYVRAFGPITGFERFSAHLTRSLFNLRKRLGMQRFEKLNQLLQQALQIQQETSEHAQHVSWIEPLMVEYYDPMYEYQRKQRDVPTLFEGSADEVIEFLRQYQPA